MYGGGGNRGVEKDSRETVCTKNPEIETEMRLQIELKRKSREGGDRRGLSRDYKRILTK